MKQTFFFLFFSLFILSLKASAFSEKNLVCIPILSPSFREFNFQMRASVGTCAAGEKLYEMKTEKGTLLFYPVEVTSESHPNVSGSSQHPSSSRSTFPDF